MYGWSAGVLWIVRFRPGTDHWADQGELSLSQSGKIQIRIGGLALPRTCWDHLSNTLVPNSSRMIGFLGGAPD